MTSLMDAPLQERSEMDIKSDIRRLNGTAAFLSSLPQEPATLALSDRQMVSWEKYFKIQ